MPKIRIGILCGGRSAEHEVSLQSAKNILDALDRAKYEPVIIGIDRSGRWSLLEEQTFLLDGNDPGRVRLNPAGDPAVLVPGGGGSIFRQANPAEFCKVDVVFPVLHGPFGEDGAVQGLLEIAGIPFVGAGVPGSALGMDKDMMKRVLRDGGLPTGKFIALRDGGPLPDFGEITALLGLPLFVKPANMGSSVGVNKVHDEAEYRAFVKDAFRFDRKVIVEEFIQGREIECAVLEMAGPCASVPGEVIPNHEFYSYDAKYLDENGAALEIPAKLPPETARRVQEMAVTVFRVLECEGLARVDFFLRDNGEIIVNEINTMPGFTRISMYPKLWEAGGIPCPRLIDRLVELALERHRKKAALHTGVV